MKRTIIRRLAPAAIITLTLAACGTDPEAVETSMAGEVAMADHAHDATLDVPADSAPTIVLEVQEDAVSGYNLHAQLTGLDLAPRAAGGEHVAGEGHMHLYVDGEKVARVYTPWFHLAELEPGSHEVTMTLNSNTHAGLAVDGEPIEATVAVEVPEAGETNMHMDHEVVEAGENMTVSLEVREDSKSGWNAFLTVDGMEFAPEHASSPPVDGEGHAHLYVDGQKIARLYGTSYHFSIAEPGTHEVMVSLNANDHSAYGHGGEPIQAMATVEVAGTPTDPDEIVEISVADGIASGPERVEVATGSVVSVTVTADMVDTVHVHAYDVMDAVSPGEPATLTFTADAPGIYEIELEESKIPLFELVVQ